MKTVTIDGIKYIVFQITNNSPPCKSCDAYNECNDSDEYGSACLSVQCGYLKRAPNGSVKSDARNAKRDHEKEIKVLNRKVEAAQTALNVIATWASFDHGRFLNHWNVEQLCKTTLEKMKGCKQ